MKKNKLIIGLFSIILVVSLTACQPNNLENENNDKNVENIETSDSKVLDQSFEERTANFVKFKKDKSNTVNDEAFLNYFYAENWIRNVSLTKVDNHYELKADIYNPTVFSKEDLAKAIEKCKDENLKSIEFNNYTIYLTEEDLLDEFEPDSFYRNLIKNKIEDNGNILINSENIPLLILNSEDKLFELVVSSKDDTKYYLSPMDRAGFVSGTIEMGDINKDAININLLKDDIICIELTDGGEILTTVTVEEYYNNSMANKKEFDSDGNYAYTYDIKNMSIDTAWYGEWIDALDIKDGKIFVYYRNGGV